MTQINPPPMLRLPDSFIRDPQVRAYQQQLQTILLQLRTGTVTGTDDLTELTALVNQINIELDENVINTDTNTGNISTNTGNISTLTPKVNHLYDTRFQNSITVNQDTVGDILSGTLVSNKVYVIDGTVDLTGLSLNFQIPTGGIFIVGFNADVDRLICSDASYTLFESVNCGSFFMQGIGISITGTLSQVYDLTNTAGVNAIEVDNVNYVNCTSLGELVGFRQGLEVNTFRSGGTPTLTLSGNWTGGFLINTSLVRGLTDGTYTLFKSGASFVMTSRFRTNQNVDLPASVSFSDFSAANFTNPSTFQLSGCILTRGGVFNALDTNITPNITSSNLACAWDGNVGVHNTFEGGRLNIDTAVETVISASSTYYDLLGTFSASDLQHFDHPSNGHLRHLGQSPVEYKVFSNIAIDGTSGDDITIKVVVYRSATTSFEDAYDITRIISAMPGSRDIAYFTISANVILNENDYVKLQVANISGTGNVEAEIDSYFFVEAR